MTANTLLIVEDLFRMWRGALVARVSIFKMTFVMENTIIHSRRDARRAMDCYSNLANVSFLQSAIQVVKLEYLAIIKLWNVTIKRIVRHTPIMIQTSGTGYQTTYHN